MFDGSDEQQGESMRSTDVCALWEYGRRIGSEGVANRELEDVVRIRTG